MATRIKSYDLVEHCLKKGCVQCQHNEMWKRSKDGLPQTNRMPRQTARQADVQAYWEGTIGSL